jgi:MYXO-CTERM domain-containing protein
MANGTKTRGWAALTVLLIAGALFSLPTTPPSIGAIAPCNTSAPYCDGSCDFTNATACYGEPVGNATACSCVLTGCCRGQLNSTMCEDLVPQPACVDGIFVANGTCANDCKIPDGGSCEDPADCESGNCVDDFCCDTACAGPEQQCNLPGQEGICSSTAAPAPAASPTGLVIGLALLIAVGAVAMLRRARAH